MFHNHVKTPVNVITGADDPPEWRQGASNSAL